MRSAVLVLTVALSAAMANAAGTTPFRAEEGFRPVKVRRSAEECLKEGEGPCYNQADCCDYAQPDGLGCFNLPDEEYGACVQKGGFHLPNQK